MKTAMESASLRKSRRVSMPRMWNAPDCPLHVPWSWPTVTHWRPLFGSGPGNGAAAGGPAGWHRLLVGGPAVAGEVARRFLATAAGAGTLVVGGAVVSGVSPGRMASDASRTGAAAAT